MADGLIPQGVIDERSITEVRADDLRGFVQCHFFAGTVKDNAQDAKVKGLLVQKVTPTVAESVIHARLEGMSIRKSAKHFGVGTTTIKNIWKNRNKNRAQQHLSVGAV